MLERYNLALAIDDPVAKKDELLAIGKELNLSVKGTQSVATLISVIEPVVLALPVVEQPLVLPEQPQVDLTETNLEQPLVLPEQPQVDLQPQDGDQEHQTMLAIGEPMPAYHDETKLVSYVGIMSFVAIDKKELPWAWNMHNINGEYWYGAVGSDLADELILGKETAYTAYIKELVEKTNMVVIIREPRNSEFIHVDHEKTFVSKSLIYKAK